MRLKQNELTPVLLFRRSKKTSSYIGTEAAWGTPEVMTCNRQPAENSINVDIYGEKISDIESLLFEPSVEIDKDCGISFNINAVQPDYRIAGIKIYQTHKVVLVTLGN